MVPENSKTSAEKKTNTLRGVLVILKVQNRKGDAALFQRIF